MTLIVATSKTPEFLYDVQKGIFQMKGRSIPENPKPFYGQISDILQQYLKNPANKTVFTFQLEYLNSTSVNGLNALLQLLNKLHQSGKEVSIQWLYEEGDDDMQEMGSRLQERVAFSFKISKG
ncbi:MAG: DUF1987 domain-containing protein [Cytophagales bacterium]|nr:MAG: DUF1987 domain-containing protein [Cytophagales bacterium]